MRNWVPLVGCLLTLAIVRAEELPLIPRPLNTVLGLISSGQTKAEVVQILTKAYPNVKYGGPSVWSGQTGYLGFQLDERYSISIAFAGNEDTRVHCDLQFYLYDNAVKRRIDLRQFFWERKDQGGFSRDPAIGPDLSILGFSKGHDSATVKLEEQRAVFIVSSSDGIGRMEVRLRAGRWPRDVTFRLNVRNLESLSLITDRFTARGSLQESGRFVFAVKDVPGEVEHHDPQGPSVATGTLNITVVAGLAGMEITLPPNLMIESHELSFAWTDTFRH